VSHAPRLAEAVKIQVDASQKTRWFSGLHDWNAGTVSPINTPLSLFNVASATLATSCLPELPYRFCSVARDRRLSRVPGHVILTATGSTPALNALRSRRTKPFRPDTYHSPSVGPAPAPHLTITADAISAGPAAPQSRPSVRTPMPASLERTTGDG
jgi:hypothetical protein